MSLTILVAKATRRIHSHAVKLHTKALRARVMAAGRNTKRAEEDARVAAAIALETRKFAQAKAVAFHKARVSEADIHTAAEAEANLIGGKL
jgi:hypothetical protein